MLHAGTPESDVVRRLTQEAANDGEAIVAWARLVFCLLVLGRFFALQHTDPEAVSLQAWLEVPVLATAAGVSILGLRLARAHRLGERGLVLWSAGDALVCFASLLSSVLWPTVLYPGLLRTPDVAVFLPLIFVSVLRLTPLATLTSWLANLAAMALLVALDLRLNRANVTYLGTEIAMMAILIMTVGATAWLATRAARSLVERTGRETARLARAQRHLDALLREHHDVRTLLSTARINVQLAQRQVPVALTTLAAVEQALAELSTFVEGVKNQAYAELATLEGRAAAAVEEAVRAAVSVAQRRFPAASIEAHVPACVVEVVGGYRSLMQLVFNLVVNACEGNGAHRATQIQVLADVNGTTLEIRVIDDGPGFGSELLTGDVRRGVSTKPGGSGLGLTLVADLVEASGGQLSLANLDSGGANVTVRLPLA